MSEKGGKSPPPGTTGQPELSVSVKRKEKPSSNPGVSGTGAEARDSGLEGNTSSALQRSVGGDGESWPGSDLISDEPGVRPEEIETASSTEAPKSRVRATKEQTPASHEPASRWRGAAASGKRTLASATPSDSNSAVSPSRSCSPESSVLDANPRRR